MLNIQKILGIILIIILGIGALYTEYLTEITERENEKAYADCKYIMTQKDHQVELTHFTGIILPKSCAKFIDRLYNDYQK